MTNIENRVTNIENRVTNIENRVTNIENRVTNIENKMEKYEEERKKDRKSILDILCSYEQVTNRQYEENKLRIEKLEEKFAIISA